MVERVHRSTATRILTAAVLPAFAALCWLVLFYSLSVSSLPLAYALGAAGVALGYLAIHPILPRGMARTSIGLVYIPVALAWSWLVGVAGACSLYNDCL
ncbi:MAG: hypothetical protein H8E63_03720 [Proteobacteria bacterium]|nr:hypothetical protein [Pseudomonadota bacterium]